MAKSLVIVESPAKAKTINKYLGADYIVDASVGHVKDLPKGALSIDIEAGFVPTYETIRGKEDVLARLRSLAARCDSVFLATDPDREGEAIASHIAEAIGDRNRTIRRVVFNEITRLGVTNAMRAPRDIDRPMVDAQEARRVMDRLIGYKVSPFLWSTFRGESKGLSAGRVQSVALRLIVERERAINSFVPVEYWTIGGHFRTTRGDEIVARLVRVDGKDIRNPSGSATNIDHDAASTHIASKLDAESLRDRALREKYTISAISKKEVKRNAPAPFTTSTMQQDAGRRLKMATKRAMLVAQKLYEGIDLGQRGRVGLITYMRTDSVRISDEAAKMAEEFIYENYGKEYLHGIRKTVVKKGVNVQDAHEAIRPTDLKITPREARKHLDADMAALYELIWNRFVASQMASAIIDQTSVDIDGGPFRFRAAGRTTRFRGWMQVYGDEEAASDALVKGKRGTAIAGTADEFDPEDRDGVDRVIPDYIRKNDALALERLDVKERATKPPPRYSESLLVKELEALGVGRPSTYASIISTVQDRGYVDQRERKLHATDLGIKVWDALNAKFPVLFDVKFTARMEGQLDEIAHGRNTYRKVLEEFYAPFERSLRALRSTTARHEVQGGQSSVRAVQSRRKVEGKATSTKCIKCGAPMDLRNGRYGPYLACTAFPTCRNIVSVPGGSAALDAEASPSAGPSVAAAVKAKRATAKGSIVASTGAAVTDATGKRATTKGATAKSATATGAPVKDATGKRAATKGATTNSATAKVATVEGAAAKRAAAKGAKEVKAKGVKASGGRRTESGSALAGAASPARKDRNSVQTEGSGGQSAGSDSNDSALLPCTDCGAPMVLRRSKNGMFYGCSGYPACRATRAVALGVKCPQCGIGDIAQRKGGRYESVFYGCTRYPECRFTASNKPVTRACSTCGNSWLAEIDSPIDGKYLECPKCRMRADG